MKIYDTLIIGGGQAGLSVAYYLRRGDVDYLVLDDQEKPGGSWLETWDSLKLFSPVTYSSLSGWMMPNGEEEYPSKDDFIAYLEAYEKRYNFPIQRNTKVVDIIRSNDLYEVSTNQGVFYAKTIVSATGTAQNPFIPDYTDHDLFEGQQLHSKDYRNANNLIGKKVLVVGGGNSGAQILAEVSKVAQTKWVTLHEPNFLPDHIDGRYLFHAATERFYGKTDHGNTPSLSDIVVVSSVKDGLERDVYQSYRPFERFYKNGVIWKDGSKEIFDVVIWCTGFKANLAHLTSLNLFEKNRIQTKNTRAIKDSNVWLVGYGAWTGFASATIYGVGKTARQTGAEIIERLTNDK